MRKNNIDTLIISDIHIPSRNSCMDRAMRIIEQAASNRLILNGDIFTDFRPNRLSKKQLQFLLFLDDISTSREIIWNAGNHDKGILEYQPMFSFEVSEKYIWTYKEKKYLAIHGHQFNHFLINFPLVYRIVGSIYTLAKFIDKKQRLGRWAKRIYINCFNPSKKIAKGAARLYRHRGIDCIICSHSHQPLKTKINGIEVYNSGTFDDIPSTYITVDENGIKIHEA